MTDEQVRKLNFDGWPLPDEYLIELGRIAAVWASLESCVNICLQKLAGFNDMSDPTAFIMLAHTNFPQRLDMLGSLCEHLSRSHLNLADCQRVIGSLRNAQKLRNKYMHNGMARNETTGDVETATGSARGTLRFSTDKVKPTDLRRVTMAIHQAMLDLYKLVLKRELLPRWERPEVGITTPLPTTDEIQNAVNRALDRLKAEDAHLFHVSVHERSLTFRLGLYLQNEFPDWRVDCEYNRHGTYPKRLDAIRRERLAETPNARTEGDVYPDIIVHCRGDHGPNLLVIEAKMASKVTAKSRRFDWLKLYAYRDELAYQSIALIVFGTDPDDPSCTADFDGIEPG